MRGTIKRIYKVTCGVCEESLTQEANSLNVFEESIFPTWRVSRAFGWIHRHCLKQLPTEHQVRELLQKGSNE